MREFLLQVWHEEDVDFGNAEFQNSDLTFEDVVNGNTEYSYTLMETSGRSLKDIIEYLYSQEADFEHGAFNAIGWYAVTEEQLGNSLYKKQKGDN